MGKLTELFRQVRQASRQLAFPTEAQTNELLCAVADAAEAQTDFILAENAKDLARMEASDPTYDRLKLTEARIRGMAEGMRKVAALPSPLAKVWSETTHPNGMRLKKRAVPFGVIGVIYEARPNVTFDVFALCFKSGNACVLKGGSDADCSNRALLKVIHAVLDCYGVSPWVVTLLEPGRAATEELLQARGYVDLLIPRGGKGLIDFVRQHAVIPVIETGAGVCHTYFDADGDAARAAAIIRNAKTRRVSVCNALDCLLVDVRRLADLPALCVGMQEEQVEIYADAAAYDCLQGHYPEALLKQATEAHYGTEFLDYKLAVKTLSGVQQAVEHIDRFGSGHSECIVTENKETAAYFVRAVDAACVYINVPTSFTDGGEFGLGAEIGISTQKLHARGPMGLEALTTYKWVLEGEGQIR